MEHAENITADSQFLEFCGITASTELTSRIWHYTHDPERFLCVTTRLQDYATAFTPTGDVRALAVRARVDAILTTSLAFAKGKRLDSAEAVPQQHADAKHRLETLFWGNTQVISLRGLSLTACGIRQAVLDDVLWYGDLAELEASLIVVRTEELRGDAGMGDVQYLAVLAAIGTPSHPYC